MSETQPGRQSPRLFATLGVAVLVLGGAFFWSNWSSSPDSPIQSGIAVAAPKAKPPTGAQAPRPATKAERTAAQKTIAAQLNAFNTGNWKEAVKFQSQDLKANFPTPEAFGQMIEGTYPAFVRPKKVQYGQSLSVNGTIQFEVSLYAHDGSISRALYLLAKENGNYRIQSVLGGVTPPPPSDAEWT